MDLRDWMVPMKTNNNLNKKKESSNVLKGANAQLELEMQANPSLVNQEMNQDEVMPDPDELKDPEKNSKTDSGKAITENTSPKSAEKIPAENLKTTFYMEDDEDNLKEDDYNLVFPKGAWNRVFLHNVPSNQCDHIFLNSKFQKRCWF